MSRNTAISPPYSTTRPANARFSSFLHLDSPPSPPTSRGRSSLAVDRPTPVILAVKIRRGNLGRGRKRDERDWEKEKEWGKGKREKERERGRTREGEFRVVERLLFRSSDFYRVIETPSTPRQISFRAGNLVGAIASVSVKSNTIGCYGA